MLLNIYVNNLTSRICLLLGYPQVLRRKAERLRQFEDDRKESSERFEKIKDTRKSNQTWRKDKLFQFDFKMQGCFKGEFV